MFARTFQNGSHLEIFDAKGTLSHQLTHSNVIPKVAKEKGDDKLFKINFPQSVIKSYDKLLKSYVFDIAGSGKTRLTFPKDDRQELGLTQHFLAFQIFIPSEAPFCLEVMITDTLKNKRRLMFTNNLREIEKTHFHLKIPLENVKKGIWLNLSFDLLSYFELFQGSIFRSIDGFNISGDFRLKRIFTMKNPLAEFDSDNESNLPYISTQVVSKAINFGAGVDYSNQLITNLSMRKASPESPSRFTDSTKLKSSVSTPMLMTVVGSQQKSPDLGKKRNISEHLEEVRKPRRPENKENSSAQSRDTRKSYLLSTADSKGELISPKFGDKIRPRRFLSPKQDDSSILKIHEIISKGRASEELTTPKKFKISQASKLQNMSLEEKKEISVGRSHSQSKGSLESSSKSSLLNRRVVAGSKRTQDPYLLVETTSNPKFEVPASHKNIAHSVRTKTTKNPWGETESTPVLKPSNSQKSALLSKHTPNKHKAKEIKTRTASQTPKDPLGESDRFSSTFNKSEYEQGWIIPGKDEGYDDDIESIEENLEYEMNSNNSITHGSSPNLREDRIRQKGIVIETSGRDKKANKQESQIDIYKAFMKRSINDTEEGSRNVYGSYSKEVHETKTKNRVEETKTTKRIIKQVEDKVLNLVSNARPYSPPFSSNLIISNRPTTNAKEKKEDPNEKKLVEVEYDPVWDCYYNSKTDEYYQLKG